VGRTVEENGIGEAQRRSSFKPNEHSGIQKMTDAEVTAEYRGLLTQTEQKSQAEFDKGVLALSGGALGLSFAFTKNIIGTGEIIHSGYLLAAWITWAASSASVLISFFVSTLALRKAIKQLDRGTIGMERPGGWWDRATSCLNLMGLLLFLIGVSMMIVFLSHNLDLK
jgi:hypothetical protein